MEEILEGTNKTIRKFHYWCPICNDIARDEDAGKGEKCMPCGCEMVKIDRLMIPVVYEFFDVPQLRSFQCCEGHWVKDEVSGNFREYRDPYIVFDIEDPDISISDLFNGHFPSIAKFEFVDILPNYKDDLSDYYEMVDRSKNVQFRKRIRLSCISRIDPFDAKNDYEKMCVEGLFHNYQIYFMEQLIEWAKSLKGTLEE